MGGIAKPPKIPTKCGLHERFAKAPMIPTICGTT
jgi:hypothetical protein